MNSPNPKCKHCHGTGRIQIPCPDNRPGCIVYHTKSCVCVTRPMAQEDELE